MNKQKITKSYNSYLEKARVICEKQIHKLLVKVDKMEAGKSQFLQMGRLLNELLRNTYSSSPQTPHGQRPSNIGAPLSIYVHKAISNFNFLGNSPDCTWLSLVFDEDKMSGLPNNIRKAINDWVCSIKSKLKHIFSDESNFFYSNVFNNWSDWFIEGCSVLRVDWKNIDKKEISFINVGAFNILLDTNAIGNISSIAYSYKLTQQEAYERGLITLEDKNQKQIDIDSYHNNVILEFIDLCISRTRNDIFPKQLTNPYLRILINKTNMKVISVKEESTFPYIVSRAISGQSLPYGKSLLWDSVNMFRYIYFLRDSERNYVAYNSNPPMFTSKSEFTTSKVLKKIMPGDIIPALDPVSLRPLYQPMIPVGDIGSLMNIYNIAKAEVAEALLANDVLPPNANQMSATEVMKRELQWNKRILPLIECRKNDFLAPLIKRCILMLYEQDELPSLSDDVLYALQCQDTQEVLSYLSVQFGGQLLNMANTQEMLDMLSFITYANNMGLGHFIKGREIIDKLCQYLNVDSRLVKTEQEIMAEQQMIEGQRARESEEQYSKTVALEQLKHGRLDEGNRESNDGVGESVLS